MATTDAASGAAPAVPPRRSIVAATSFVAWRSTTTRCIPFGSAVVWRAGIDQGFTGSGGGGEARKGASGVRPGTCTLAAPVPETGTIVARGGAQHTRTSAARDATTRLT